LAEARKPIQVPAHANRHILIEEAPVVNTFNSCNRYDPVAKSCACFGNAPVSLRLPLNGYRIPLVVSRFVLHY
jgi:hypothetical protein